MCAELNFVQPERQVYYAAFHGHVAKLLALLKSDPPPRTDFVGQVRAAAGRISNDPAGTDPWDACSCALGPQGDCLPLNAAAGEGHHTCVKLLLDAGAAVDSIGGNVRCLL